ncbi:uncharacterized protein si:dkey-225f5.4 isoform X2 [Platichthys flesus]|uniref:uncharacterized protein si:dkey-225f5.4 isoform X2 n=1 Tax=Platichthys flesus TaxID=8260 RepID=UPI002DBA1855|nr:uncharacterized protein si:dkey-225f5.4 isoform X2 [Platichthys flesus]
MSLAADFKTEMAEVRAVLQSCDSSLLDLPGNSDQSDSAEAAMMVLYLTDSRRVQKVLWRQLFVLDSMMSLLESLASVQQLVKQPCPTQPEGGARGRWKALKVDYRSGVEEMETLLRSVQDRVQQIHKRRHTLTQLVQKLHSKQMYEKLEASLLKAQNALQSCDRQLTQLREESEAVVSQLISWKHLRDELQEHVSAAQSVMQIKLLSLSQSELCVELRPRPSSDLSSNELEPLKLSVSWSVDGRFRLQVDEGTAGLVEGSSSGKRAQLSAALLEVMQCYVGQAELLSEVQALRSSFAIDWRPAQRQLIFLKSSSVVCHLEVEEGYPGSGSAQLSSVQRDGRPVDMCGLKPQKLVLRLSDWLIFLSTCPLI